MFLRERVRHCAVCDEVTAHSRRLVSVPLLFVSALLIAAGWYASLGAGPALVGVPLLWAATIVFLWDRERCWRVRCERCRAKKRAALRATKPALDGSTEIGIG